MNFVHHWYFINQYESCIFDGFSSFELILISEPQSLKHGIGTPNLLWNVVPWTSWVDAILTLQLQWQFCVELLHIIEWYWQEKFVLNLLEHQGCNRILPLNHYASLVSETGNVVLASFFHTCLWKILHLDQTQNYCKVSGNEDLDLASDIQHLCDHALQK